jgi:aminoglycoside phosphotransferase family enzyme
MSAQLAQSLLEGKGVEHSLEDPRLIETHVSWLILLGEYAYKIKKPLDLGFLDFTTLEKRQYFCYQEVRLNRRTAPEIYLGVIPISGDDTSPRPGDDSAPFEYAVRMKRFDDSQLLNNIAAKDGLDEQIIRRLAESISAFHLSIRRREVPPAFATPVRVREPSDQNFEQTRPLLMDRDERRLIAELESWADTQHTLRQWDFQFRHDHGFVRECHGDLHLANIFFDQNRCTLFDCIEFNESFRWTDVACDIAFTIMDLESSGHPVFAHLLLNEYLQHTGDYGCLSVLDYYLVYRAMVRAKVAAIRADQDPGHAARLHEECRQYLSLARSYTESNPVSLTLMSGLSGSGKTTVARQLASRGGAIHIRSDVERKRIFGLSPMESSRGSDIDIYSEAADALTFGELESLARMLISRGFSVIADATFIKRDLRERFEAVASEMGVPWKIVSCGAPEWVVRERLANRAGDASEAGFQQFLAQKDQIEAFTALEMDQKVDVNTGQDGWIEVIMGKWGE